MEGLIATVSTKGQLVIPAEMREALGIVPGARVSLTLADGMILLRPVSERLVDETCAMFAGWPSMTDDLEQDRRTEKW